MVDVVPGVRPVLDRAASPGLLHLVADALRREAKRPAWLSVVVLSSVAGVLVAAWPAGLSGNETTLGFLGGSARGVEAMERGGPGAAFLLAVVATGSDDDSGVAREWHLAAVRPWMRAVAGLVVAAAATAALGVMLVFAAALSGAADEVVRHAAGVHYSVEHTSVRLRVGALGALSAALVLGCAVAVAVRSSRRSLTATALLVASLLLGLLLPVGPVRDVIAVHPLAGFWRLAYSGRSLLRPPLGEAAAAVSAGGWAAAAVVAAAWRILGSSAGSGPHRRRWPGRAGRERRRWR